MCPLRGRELSGIATAALAAAQALLTSLPAALRSAALMRSCQPGPPPWKCSSTSRSIRNVTLSLAPGSTAARAAGVSARFVVTDLKAFSAASRASSEAGFLRFGGLGKLFLLPLVVSAALQHCRR